MVQLFTVLLSCIALLSWKKGVVAAFGKKNRRHLAADMTITHRRTADLPCSMDALLAANCTLDDYCESLHIWKCGENWKEECHAAYSCSGSVLDFFTIEEREEEECEKIDGSEISFELGYDITPDEYNETTFVSLFDEKTMYCYVWTNSYTFSGSVATAITWSELITQPAEAAGGVWSLTYENPPPCDQGSYYLPHGQWCEKDCPDKMTLAGETCTGSCETCTDPDGSYTFTGCTNLDPSFTACGSWLDSSDPLLDYYRGLTTAPTGAPIGTMDGPTNAPSSSNLASIALSAVLLFTSVRFSF